MLNLLRKIFVREADAHEDNPAIWAMRRMIIDCIHSAVTYEQLQSCERMVQQEILERYKYMPFTAKTIARHLYRIIERKELALRFDNLNTISYDTE